MYIFTYVMLSYIAWIEIMGKKPFWLSRSKDPIALAFYFFNHSILGRTSLYQSRKIEKNKPEKLNFVCSNCGKNIKGYVLNFENELVCHSCKSNQDRAHLTEERKQIIQNAVDSAMEFKELLANCEKKGTCDVLASHKELLKDDDNRLRTDFLLKLICKNDYETEWDKIKANVKAQWNR